MRNEAVARFVNEITLPGNADGGQNIVSGTHHLPYPSFRKLVKNVGSSGLQLVLKYDEPDEV